jgi:uncharacterized protein (DUF697 family)
MPAGIGVGRLLALVRETRSLEQRAAAISIRGPGAAELAAGLVAGGDASAVRVGLQQPREAATVVILAAAPGQEEQEAMRHGARAGAPVVVVRAGGFAGPVPYALPSDVIDAGEDDDALLGRVVDVLAAALGGDDAVALAGRLPVLREAVEQRVIRRTSLANAALAAAPWLKEAHLPLLSLAQARMLLGLGVAEGSALPHDPQRLAAAAGPPLGGALVAGLGLRALYRRLPVGGPLPAALVAYAGTRALGEVRTRIAP